MIKKMERFFIFLQLLAVLIIALPSFAHSGEIIIKPGKFDHFNISLPEKLSAGEEAVIKLQAVDIFNNLITNFGETEREFRVSVSGSAAVKPASFKSSAFVNGTINISLTGNVAETFNLSIRESTSSIPILTKNLTIVPNKLNSFVIKGPNSAVAGEKFDIKITAKDSFGNTVSEQIYGKNINLIFKGTAEPKVTMPSIPDFKNGACSVSLLSEKAGTAIIEAKDLITGSSGTGDKIEITNGPLSSFKIFTPKEAIAGEPFEVSIVAVDRFDNVVLDYAMTGRGIYITTSGKLKPFPSVLSAHDFVNGQIKVDLRYDAAEDIKIIVSESGKAIKGTASIKIDQPLPDRFDVVTPESAYAGQKFKIKITVYNQRNQVIKNYNLIGTDVQLLTTGSGTLTPNIIPASEFVNGSAVVEVQYNKSETFAITASQVIPIAKKIEPVPAPKKQPVKTTTTTPVPVKKPAKKKDKKDKKTAAAQPKKPFEVTKISFDGSSQKSAMIIKIPNLDGAVKYDAFTAEKDGKKWIILNIRPAINKIVETIKLDSPYVGNVLVEEKEKDTLLIKVELLKQASFNVTKEKHSVVVTFKKD
jgi:hypothetical protein